MGKLVEHEPIWLVTTLVTVIVVATLALVGSLVAVERQSILIEFLAIA